jgi:hypothetical protein
MYETIDSSGKPVIIYEMTPQAKMHTEFIPYTTGPVYYSKNSHKRTNKRKRKKR